VDSIITMNKNCKGGTDMAHQKEGDSMGLFKKKNVRKSYDRECMKPVIHASICTGEQVAGFKDIQTGKLDILLADSIISSSKQFQEMKNFRLLKAGDGMKIITRAKYLDGNLIEVRTPA